MFFPRRYLVAVCLVLGSCGSPSDIPDEPPTIDGSITALPSPNSVLIEADVSKCERYVFTITTRTRVLIRRANGAIEVGAPDDLRVAQRARAWADGPIAESCPMQTTAGAIEIR
jgi:hypothetical protein